MKIEDLIHLLDNRLREFQLSRDYARMSGNLERMNVADKEVLALEDTLYKLHLLVDTSKSAAVRETTLTEAITDGSVAVLGDYDITSYATDPLHEEKVMNILSRMGVMDTVEKIDEYITGKYLSSPVTGEMVMSAALAYDVDTRLMMAIMEQDSRFGTAGVAVRTLNPGNVGNDDGGNTRTYESWQEGVTAVAEWLSRHRGSTIISEAPDTATSTPPMATSTPTTATTTPSTASSTPLFTPSATTTPVVTISTTTTATTTPVIATPTPVTATSTPITATTTPAIVTTTPVTATSTTTTATTTPSTATSTPLFTPSATTTPVTATTPVVTTSTTTTATSTPATAPVTATDTTPVTAASTSSGQATSTPPAATAMPVTATTTPVTATPAEWQATTTEETAAATSN